MAAALTLGSAAVRGDAGCPLPPLEPPFTRGTLVLDGATTLELDIARTQEQRMRGLMCSPPLAAQQGMLLSYPSARRLGIWMKNMTFPLDILFLDSRGRILSIVESAPPCTEDPCPVYHSRQRAHHALELKAGDARALGLTPGRRLQLLEAD